VPEIVPKRSIVGQSQAQSNNFKVALTFFSKVLGS